MLDGVVIDDTELFNDKLQEWENFYNFDRPHGSRGVAARRAVGAIRGSRHLWKIPAAAQHRHVDHEPDDTIETSNASILSAQITSPARKTQVTMSTGVFGTHRPIAARIRQVLV